MTFKTFKRNEDDLQKIFLNIFFQVCSEMVGTRQGLQTRLGDKGFYFVTVGIESKKVLQRHKQLNMLRQKGKLYLVL